MQRALVEQAARGDEDAFASLAAASADRLMAIAFRILRDVGRAEDAVQQALLNAWRELPNLRDPERFEAWLRRLLVNACYAEARRERRWSSNIRVLTLDDAPASADASTAIALRDEFERLFRRLPPDQRAVLVYRHYLGYDLAEIATSSRSRSARSRAASTTPPTRLRSAMDADRRAATTSPRSDPHDDRPTDFDRYAREWLEDGPVQLADPVLDATLVAVHRTPSSIVSPSGGSSCPSHRRG